jgi:DNA polymerase III epsilon subunit family exonuclease
MPNRPNSDLQLTAKEIADLLEYFPNGICAFDLEMTGLSPLFDKIIEIAGIKLLPDGTTEIFHTLINPLIPIPEHTIQYHGLTNEDLHGAPTLKKPLVDFLSFFGNLPLVAHSAQFDAGFIIRGIHEYNFETSLSDIYDSCRTARTLYKNGENPPESFKLSDLAKFYNIEFDHHQALDDAIVCLKVFAQSLQHMKTTVPNENIKNIGFLFKLNSFKKSTEYLLPNKLEKLKGYVAGQTQIYIKYKGGSFKGKFRPIKPISLMALPQGLVLYAECIPTKMNKYFKVQKIQSLSLSEKET